MDLAEKLIKQHEVFSGKLLHAYDDEVELPNGHRSRREYVRHQGGACMCALDEDYNVFLVRQFRYPYGKETLEIPAGKVEPGEDPLACAVRELREETGMTTRETLSLGKMYPSPGYTDEVISMFLAVHVEQDEQDLDPDEFVNVEKMSLMEAVSRVMNDELPDGKTQVAILKTYFMLRTLSEQQESQDAEERMRAEAE